MPLSAKVNALVSIAVQRNDYKAFHRLIKSGLDLSKIGKELACIAAEKGYLEILLLLIDNKVAMDGPSYKESPLFLAVKNGHMEVFDLLTTQGEVHVNRLFFDGISVLHMAVQLRNARMVSTLLRAGANCYQRYKQMGCIEYAAINGDVSVMEQFLRYKKTVDLPVVLLAIRYGHGALLELMAQYTVSFNEALIEDQLPIVSAIAYQQCHLFPILARNGVDFQQLFSDGSTLIHKAVSLDKVRVIEKLIAFGGDVNKRDYNGATPLLLAALIGNKAAVDELLRHHAQLDIPVELPITMLFNYCSDNHRVDIKGRSDKFIQRYKEHHPNSKFIEVYPYQMAYIMGHHRIAVQLESIWMWNNEPNSELIVPVKPLPLHRVSASLMIDILASPAIKVAAVVLLLVGMGALIAGTMGMAVIGVAIAGGGMAAAGGLLGAGGFFASSLKKQESIERSEITLGAVF